MIPAPLYRLDYRGIANHDCDQEPPGVFEPGRYYRPVADGWKGPVGWRQDS